MRTMWWLAVASLCLIGCDDGGTQPDDDDVVPTEELAFTRFAESVTLPVRDTSFVAYYGQEARLELFTAPEPGEDSGERFLEFRVGPESLLRHPDGSPFQPGDSVVIRVSIPGDAFVFYFEPSGLVFDPEEPAELEIEYANADPDLDDDGDEDEEDLEFERELSIWKQESAGDPWVRLGSAQVEELDEIEAEITSFTGFALAGN